MKKVTFLFAVFALILSSCSKDAFTVKGKFKEDTFNGKLIYLYKADLNALNEPQLLDSATIENASFTIKGTEPKMPLMGVISTAQLNSPSQLDENTPIAMFILEYGTISVDFEGASVVVGGTERNTEFNKIHQAIKELTKLQEQAQANGGIEGVPADKEGKDGIAQYQDLMEKWRVTNYDFASKNMDNQTGQFVFLSSIETLFTPDQMKTLLDLSTDEFKQRDEIKRIKSILDSQNPSHADASDAGKVVDVELTDKDGKKSMLFSIIEKNEYTLIDFWASWCGPCMKEVPNLKKAYDKYKSKGFEIVGVSLDEDQAAWQGAINKNEMTWMHFFDLGGAAAGQYGVTSIPFTLLVDKSGTVVAANFRGTQLDEKLAELLK